MLYESLKVRSHKNILKYLLESGLLLDYLLEPESHHRIAAKAEEVVPQTNFTPENILSGANNQLLEIHAASFQRWALKSPVKMLL